LRHVYLDDNDAILLKRRRGDFSRSRFSAVDEPAARAKERKNAATERNDSIVPPARKASSGGDGIE